MTHNYPEIKPADIREGDLIRWEHSDSDAACEWRQTRHGRAEHRPGTYFLINRPTPPVELPTEPAFGWVEHADNRRRLGRFFESAPTHPADGEHVVSEIGSASRKVINRLFRVTAFTPATAVPTESLDALRDAHNAANRTTGWQKDSDIRHDAMLTFLADVDRANS